MKVIDYIELLSYGKYDYYDTKFSINNTGIKGNFTMNDFCQRLALTEEVLNMEIEIIEDTPKKDTPKKIEKLYYCEENTLSNLKEPTYLSVKERQLIDSAFKTIKEKFDEIIDKINGE